MLKQNLNSFVDDYWNLEKFLYAYMKIFAYCNCLVDFMNLNGKIINDKFPLTTLRDLVDKLDSAKYFLTFDKTSSFHQTNLGRKSRAFSTNKEKYHFRGLLFALKIPSDSFKRILTIALSGLTLTDFYMLTTLLHLALVENTVTKT